jgi:uncharacterized membrane protein
LAEVRTRFAAAPQRLDALSDGVFAVVLTLLALELRLPEAGVDDGFLAVLSANAKVLESYIVSFYVVGVLWRLQHMVSDLTPRGTPFHYPLTLAFLAGVTLTPWSLDNLTSFPEDADAVMSFSGILLVSWALLIAILSLALKLPEIDADQEAAIRRTRFGLLGGPVTALLSIALAPISTSAALYAWLLLLPWALLARRRRYPQTGNGS